MTDDHDKIKTRMMEESHRPYDSCDSRDSSNSQNSFKSYKSYNVNGYNWDDSC